ncbi:hypothetical protein [Cellulomonas rhizosphaerae]|uniref:hypothetical protein n=1 Tax=Cellulomonas rhizosphaerae TaxID=2293719 RepID=UPI001F43D223|nr:hypothetical protein [Cellulomonas rhizosphaerae]
MTFSDLDRAARAPLRTLTKDNAERVGRHLVMVGRLIDDEPELAYEHAQAAVQRAGRVDVVRESAGLTAYRTGRYAEALRELRTVRRLNGSSEHLPIMADCERGLGRPERAITLSQEPEAETLEADGKVELAIVVSGARLDLGEPDAALATLASPLVRAAKGVLAVRVAQARATALEAAGRTDEAAAALGAYSAAQLAEASGGVVEDEDDVVVFDLDEDEDHHDAHDEADDSSADEARGGEVEPTDGADVESGVEDDTDESDDDDTDDVVENDASDVDATNDDEAEPATDVADAAPDQGEENR